MKILEEEEEKNKKDFNNFQKTNNNNIIGDKSFYIPTLVQSFPELLYDKINKKQEKNQKLQHNISFPLLVNKNNIEQGKDIYKTIINEETNNMNNSLIKNKSHDKMVRIINNYNYKTKINFKSILKNKKIKDNIIQKLFIIIV